MISPNSEVGWGAHAPRVLFSAPSRKTSDARKSSGCSANVRAHGCWTRRAPSYTRGRVLKVEQADEPTEIVIHVNMLKEGWDVTNLYTIIPLRAANARILIEQSIERGLRLPYGKRTGVNTVDRLNIIAHDKFQEIVDEAQKPDSAIRLQQVILEPEQIADKTVTVVSQSQLASKLGLQPEQTTASTFVPQAAEPPVFTTPEEQKVAQITYGVIRRLENQPLTLPSVSYLAKPEVQALVLHEVQTQYRPSQLEIEGVTKPPDLAAIVARTSEVMIQQTIDIPRILVVPTGKVQSGFNPLPCLPGRGSASCNLRTKVWPNLFTAPNATPFAGE